MQRPVTSKSRGICRYYNTSRGCFAGDKCKFKHGEHEKLTPYDKSKSCRYFAAGYCKRGENCWFKHVSPSKPSADPAEPSICSICMEEPITFGLLVDCSHVFCIDCIRNWRGQDSTNDDISLSHVHKKCPYCRTPSKFVIPSSHFYPSGHPGKAVVIEQYKESLQRIPCKYFVESNPNRRYCPFGCDCMYQHLNEDGTPYVFTRGVDYYMQQRDRRLRGSLRDALTRSFFEHYHNLWAGSPDPSEEEPLGQLVFGVGDQLGLEQDDTGSDNDVYLAMNTTLNPNVDTLTGQEDAPTVFPSISTTLVVTLPPNPIPVPESTHPLALSNTQPSDTPLPSIPSSPFSTSSSMPPLMAASDCGTEPNHPDTTNTSTASDIFQDSRPPQPIDEPTTISDRIPRPHSLPSTPSTVRFSQRSSCRDTGTSMPTSPVPSQVDSVDAHSSPRAPLFEASSVLEVGTTASTQLPTRDPLCQEGSDTRQQEPPFMTDGRGRVVWSRSGVKPGSSPHSNRSQDRTTNAPGDRD